MFILEKKTLTIFLSRTNWLISIKLHINHHCMRRILVCSNKGSGSLQRGNDHKNAKIG
jgi:hypothetical protein